MMSVILGGARVLGCAFKQQGAEPLVGTLQNKGEAFVQDLLDVGVGEAPLLAYDLHCGPEAIMLRHRFISGWI